MALRTTPTGARSVWHWVALLGFVPVVALIVPTFFGLTPTSLVDLNDGGVPDRNDDNLTFAVMVAVGAVLGWLVARTDDASARRQLSFTLMGGLGSFMMPVVLLFVSVWFL